MAWRYFLRFLAEGDEEAARINHRLWTELAPPLLRFRYALKFWGMIRWRLLNERRRALSRVRHPSGEGLIRVRLKVGATGRGRVDQGRWRSTFGPMV